MQTTPRLSPVESRYATTVAHLYAANPDKVRIALDIVTERDTTTMDLEELIELALYNDLISDGLINSVFVNQYLNLYPEADEVTGLLPGEKDE